MMRVTSGTYADRLVSNLGNITARQAKYQAQIATGQRVTLPEDDPSAVRRALDLDGERGRVGQFGRNIARLKETATTTKNFAPGHHASDPSNPGSRHTTGRCTRYTQ